ncbi:MAG: M48 family metallopeptidase [Chloroflexi bacterium]|nr:M48 family metallopeptidase [Chloroflexota bacterium]
MDLNYTIVRSPKRRKLTITVERDRSVVVHAPEKTSDAKIRQVVESKRQWLFDKIHHCQKYAELPHPPGKELVNGESVLYLGRNYRIKIVPSASGNIEFSRFFVVPPEIAAEGQSALAVWFKQRAGEKILPRVRYHAKQLGVDYEHANIVDSRYRWGSCTPGNTLNFNWRLIKAPMAVLDYVIIHELAHLIEGNHTPRFWNIVKAQCPSSEKAKEWLMQHGQMLESEI